MREFDKSLLEIPGQNVTEYIKNYMARYFYLRNELYLEKTFYNIERYYIKEINTDEIKINYRGLK